MSKYNDTTYAILGILTTSCRSGYAIKQFIDQSLNHFWKISYGQIYPTLKLITEEGLAELETHQQPGKPDRHDYILTDKGRDVLKAWLEQPIVQIPVERNEVLLKLFFGNHQSQSQTVKLLQSYKEILESRYEVFESIEQFIQVDKEGEGSGATYWLLTLDYGKRTTQAAIEWCEASMQKMNGEEQ
ncbi:PadR family transcriptional regulator [Paenibacillus sp. NPDC058071]|uniref:PadR family transcriptional regulator n=1 Tax=Paenibacillus sp. NPDC058071 TaxID=3346326 RepID=UPI0036D9B27C